MAKMYSDRRVITLLQEIGSTKQMVRSKFSLEILNSLFCACPVKIRPIIV